MNVQQVWQAQSTDAPRMSLAYVRQVSSDFERRRSLRAGLSSVALVVVCALYASLAWRNYSAKPLLLSASICMILGMVYVLYRLYRHVTAEASPTDAGVLDTLRFQRRQLARQRDWRRGSSRWTILVLSPSYALILASLYFENDPIPWGSLGKALLIFIAGAVLSLVNGERKARQSQREIDALNSLEGNS